MRVRLYATLLAIGLAVTAPLQAQTADSVLTPGRILRITGMAQGLEQQIAIVDRFYRDTIFVKAQITDGSRTVTERDWNFDRGPSTTRQPYVAIADLASAA